MARPRTGETKSRNIRVPDGLWEAAQTKAAEEGRTITEVIRAALQRYVSAPPKSKPPTDS